MFKVPNIAAQIMTVGELLSLGVFTPAGVQRDYLWDTNEGQTLLADLERASTRHLPPVIDGPGDDEAIDPSLDPGHTETPPFRDPAYYLGSVVLGKTGPGQYEIYDGFQRLTTLTILICVLRDLCTSHRVRTDLHSLVDAAGKWRISLAGQDPTLVDEVQHLDAGSRRYTRRVSDRGFRIRALRRQYERFLRDWEESDRDRLITTLLAETKLTVIETQDAGLARQIFVTANNRGKRLEQIDLFRSQLADLTNDSETANSVLSRYDVLREKLGNDLNEFMLAVDFIYRRKSQSPDALNSLIDHISQNYTGDRLSLWFDQVLRYANGWVELKRALGQSSGPGQAIRELRFIPWLEWKPLALAWMADFISKRDASPAPALRTLKARFPSLGDACLAITLAGYSEVKRAEIFGTAISQWRNSRSPFAARNGALTFNDRTKRRIEEALLSPIEHEVGLYLMRWIETKQHDADRAPEVIWKGSLEHILPKRPEPYGEWYRDFPDEGERHLLCHSLGNFCLLDFEANEAIGNKVFSAKKPTFCEQAQKILDRKSAVRSRVMDTGDDPKKDKRACGFGSSGITHRGYHLTVRYRRCRVAKWHAMGIYKLTTY